MPSTWAKRSEKNKKEIMAVSSEILAKHVRALCGQNVEFVDVTPGGKYGKPWA